MAGPETKVSDRTSSKHLLGLHWPETLWLGFPLLWLAFALGLVLRILCHDTLWIGGCKLGRLNYGFVTASLFAHSTPNTAARC